MFASMQRDLVRIPHRIDGRVIDRIRPGAGRRQRQDRLTQFLRAGNIGRPERTR
jgi:hypothetical protein